MRKQVFSYLLILTVLPTFLTGCATTKSGTTPTWAKVLSNMAAGYTGQPLPFNSYSQPSYQAPQNTNYQYTASAPSYVPQSTNYQSTAPTSTGATQPTYLGQLSTNKYAADSTSNQYGQYGSPYGSGVNNPYSSAGMAARSQYSSGGPKLYGQDGQFLGNLNSNQYDPNSVSNPYGKYGSKYSSTSINNQYGTYGSQYSNQSATNPYATDAPIIVDNGY